VTRQVVPGPPYPGVYEHYKGDLYVVHKVITDSTNGVRNGRIMVLYESLKEKELHVRDIREFIEHVHPDGSPMIHHHLSDKMEECEECVPRFAMKIDFSRPEERT